ncbi:MAG: phosphotransferase [Promethearchaeota archaeon]
MLLSKSKIKDIISYYDIGSLIKFKGKLDNGFQSENFHILTDRGDFVVRVLYDTEKNIKISMKVYEYLARNGIKTPNPMRTKENALFLFYKKQIIVIQTFLEGSDVTNLKKVNQLLPFFGKKLGKIHYISKKMVDELGKEMFSRDRNTIASVRNMAIKYMVNDDYIYTQYKEWENDIERLPAQLLTKAVIHGDIGPKDFFFKNGSLTGIIDFNTAGYDYLLFDIAPMMMYCGIYHPKRINDYIKFVHAYLEESPIKKEEFKWLYLILKTRWLGQIFQHQYRYVEGITRGLDTNNREENLQGVKDGKYFLKILENSSHNDFFEVL